VIGDTEGCHICQPVVPSFVAALREVLQRGRRTNGRDAVGHLDGRLIASRLIRVYESVLRGSARAVAPSTT
jgi:hypothetical protein